MKKTYTLAEFCHMFGITMAEALKYIEDEELLYVNLRGNQIGVTDRQVKRFKEKWDRLPQKRKSHAHEQKESKSRQLVGDDYLLPVIRKGEMPLEEIEVEVEAETKQDDIQHFVGTADESEIMQRFETEVEEDKELKKRETTDICEWNPYKNFENTDDSNHQIKAEWILGAKGNWRLCGECAKLPRFKRYTKRKRI